MSDSSLRTGGFHATKETPTHGARASHGKTVKAADDQVKAAVVQIAELATIKLQGKATVQVVPDNGHHGRFYLNVNNEQVAKVANGRITAITGTSLGSLKEAPEAVATNLAAFVEQRLTGK